MKNYLTLREFAEKCGVTEGTVRTWIKRGAVDAQKKLPKGRYYINPLDVPTFMREKEGENEKS